MLENCTSYLNKFCLDIRERCVGSKGNIEATSFFEKTMSQLGWKTETPEFEAIDWKCNDASLICEDSEFQVFASPFSLGCGVTAELTSAENIQELEKGKFEGKIILLHGDIAREQLMPKNFVFYNPDRHKKIISLLENSGALALACATGRNPDLAGGVYPFPLIEDGDFHIPSVYMTEEEGKRLITLVENPVILKSDTERIPSKGCNVIATKGSGKNRIVVTAHIDAKKGTPGAIDNATGVVILLLLAGLLKDHQNKNTIELVALNGEDYYAVPGQMNYIMSNQGKFDNILLNINIDGAGYKKGKSAISMFDLPPNMSLKIKDVIESDFDLMEGVEWPQGDHSIFIHQGVPAIAASSQWFIDNISVQDITHTPKDNTGIVDCSKVVKLAESLNKIIRKL